MSEADEYGPGGNYESGPNTEYDRPEEKPHEHYMSIPVVEFEELQDRIMRAEQERDEAKRELKELQAYVHKQTEAWRRHD